MERLSVFYEHEGEEYCVEERALAYLLLDEILLASGPEWGDGQKTCLSVNCSDVFGWACADAEDLPTDQIGRLYKMHLADPNWGSTKWCCLQRKQRPQAAMEKMMRKEGAWDEEMEGLPE